MPEHTSHLKAFLLISVLILLTAGPLLAGEYLPLALDNTWTLLSPFDEVEVKVITGTEVVRGTETWVKTTTVSPENEGLRNFWTSGPNGEVILHGFARPEMGIVYDPPLLFLDPTVPVGQSYTQTIMGYAFGSGQLVIAGEMTTTIHEVVPLVVPAGTFEAVGFDSFFQRRNTTSIQGFTLTGEMAAPGGRDARYHMSENVGWVRYDLEHPYELLSYEVGPVTTARISFGSVKALFR